MAVHFTSSLLRQALLGAVSSGLVLFSSGLKAQSAPQAARVWTSQDGRTLTATLVEVAGGNAVLLLPNGTRSNVPLANLSQADQAYLRTAVRSPAAPAAGGIGWPKEVISLDSKSIVVTEGK